MAQVKLLDTIEGVPINLFYSFNGDEMVRFRSGARIDADGSGSNPDHDPYFQSNTTLHRDGKPLDADVEPFVVVPPVVCRRTVGIVLGSLCLVENVLSGRFCFAVVGDLGPPHKIGEISPAAAVLVDVNPNSVSGGVEQHIIQYTIFVGVPCVLEKFKYVLQKYGG